MGKEIERQGKSEEEKQRPVKRWKSDAASSARHLQSRQSERRKLAMRKAQYTFHVCG